MYQKKRISVAFRRKNSISLSSINLDDQIIIDVDKFKFVEQHENPVEIYIAIVNSVSLNMGTLAPLPLKEGGVLEVPLYLILAHPYFVGPGVQHLADIIKKSVSITCGTSILEAVKI